jgi:hypothetical protein
MSREYSADAVKFFRSHGFNPTRAIALARAESRAESEGWIAMWEEDEDRSDAWGDHVDWCEAARAGQCHGHDTEVCVLRRGPNAFDDVLASLGGIVDAETSYRRIVEAELAEEAIAELDVPRPALALPLDAGHTHSGNPRRGWLILDSDGNTLAFVDEGYDGPAALRKLYPSIAVGPTIVTNPKTYRTLLRAYPARR